MQHAGWIRIASRCTGQPGKLGLSNLDLTRGASQTQTMSHIYLKFDFGTDEDRAQQARHKLDGWKQAFRLDKRLLYKLDRPESEESGKAAKPEAGEKPAPSGKTKAKAPAKASGKAESGETSQQKPTPAANGKVGLLVRLYFSSHEKLSEQRWLSRIPTEEPFKSASPKIIHPSDAEFESTDRQFEALD